MCGFTGFTGQVESKETVLRRMADRIRHRGPDSDGYFFDEEGGVALGFRRLSIIDLSDGTQPMFNEDGTVAIVYNGEIYNFPELRAELISRGHVFRTRCDTEVIVHGYEEYGDGIVDRLRGMFAFVIWDKKRRRLFGARDPFGIKPFYYTLTPSGNMIFGSEIKSFLEHPEFHPEVDPTALRPYLSFQYSVLETTFFKNTFKLPPAHVFEFSEGKFTKRRYWDVDFSKKELLSYGEWADRIDERVRESVTAHRISDVKVGSFLSGGVDSSYITAALMPHDTFSVGFGPHKFDETGEAKELSRLLGIENYLEHLNADECFDAFSDIQYHMDEPQSNPSSVPLYFLARLAARHVTVVLSGEGADEIYAGYEWYDDTPMMRKYKKIPSFLRGAAANVASHLPQFRGHDFLIKGSGDPRRYFIGQAFVFPEKEAEAVLRPKYRVGPSPHEITSPIYDKVKDLCEVEQKQYLDLSLWLPGDILLKADKMSMAHSLELRVPYLDKYVMAEAATIPWEYKINGVDTKAVLRTAANKTLPDEWANRPKKGFPVPIRNWLAEDKFYDRVKTAFSSDVAAEYFDNGKLLSLLEDHKNGKANNGRKIWTAFTFLTWHDRFIS